MQTKIGFMQGRLSPMYQNKIQCFPTYHWKNEFSMANSIGINLMEWTLDYENLIKNPLLTISGKNQIKFLSSKFNITIPSVTGDCFMQRPIWKEDNKELKIILDKEFNLICKSCSALNIKFLVIPLVDSGSLEDENQIKTLIDWLNSKYQFLKDCKLEVLFESDFQPKKFKEFLKSFPSEIFGVNYDIGNSASLGYAPDDEFELFGNRIKNVHVKDRILGGTTVPLGKGNANFKIVFKNLNSFGYEGNLIMQTARSNNGQHLFVLNEYRLMIEKWINESTFGS